MALIFLVGGAFEGKKEYARAHYPGAKVIADYHLRVREQLEEGMNPMTEAERLLQDLKGRRTDTVLLSDEIGCGVIPLDPKERNWREYNGRVNCRIAAEADRVIRIIAGMPQILKA